LSGIQLLSEKSINELRFSVAADLALISFRGSD
jgi:hypothetical protein